MQVVRQNCESCVGPTREACDDIYARMREKGGRLLTSATVFALEDGDDVIGMMEMQQQTAHESQEMRVEIKALGCTLPDADLQIAAMSEISAGMVLAEPDEEEIIERVQERRDDRLRGFIAEAETLRTEGYALIERVQQEVADAQSLATQEFCEAQGWDPENLGFVERMDLQAHLRSEGYIK